MSKEHDLFSMLHVVQLFEPVKTEGDLHVWWQENVVTCKQDELFNLIKKLLEFPDSDLVKVKDDVKIGSLLVGTAPP